MMIVTTRISACRLRSEIPGICNPHHIHIWPLDETSIHFEAHVGTDRETLRETEPIAERIEQMLLERFGITHVTLQFESGFCLTRPPHPEHDHADSSDHAHHDH